MDTGTACGNPTYSALILSVGDVLDPNDGALSNYCLFLYLSLVVKIEIELKQNKLLFTLANTFVKYQYKPLKMINWVVKNRDEKM